MKDSQATAKFQAQGEANSHIQHQFKFNPNSVEWGYKQNTRSFDTLGGRVIQILSVKAEQMTIQGDAGSKRELQRLASNVAAIMQYHLKTQRPVKLVVPSRDWRFHVYLTQFPNIGWNTDTISYPFQLTMEVSEDFGISYKRILKNELNRLKKNVGYDPKWHGGDAALFDKAYAELYGGDDESGGGGGGNNGSSSVSVGKGEKGNGPYGGTPSKNKQIGKDLARTMYGWTGAEWDALEELWQNESGWDQYADNLSSSAYGIPQSLDDPTTGTSKMATEGKDWQWNSATQIRWGLKYIKTRPDYGTPSKALALWKQRGWY